MITISLPLNLAHMDFRRWDWNGYRIQESNVIRARETGTSLRCAVLATAEHRRTVQSSLTRRDGPRLTIIPALKNRAKVRSPRRGGFAYRLQLEEAV
jgi:hypothetical protein